MKWKYYELAENDQKAKKQIVVSLEIGAIDHTLSKKLLARFSGATGSMLAVALESLDLDRLTDYSYATYDGGQTWQTRRR